jgi:type I restriction enzyme, S subunit
MTSASGWPLVPLAEVLQLQRRWIKPEPTDMYREIGIRSFGKGIFHKAPIAGSTLGNKRVLRIEPGDLVLNNVFAWEGAVAVAGPLETGMIGSHRFVTYTVNPSKSSAEFLRLFFATEAGRELLLKASPGSAGRNKTLGLDRFISNSVPLPSLDEQRRIVAKIHRVAGKIEEVQTIQGQRMLECSNLAASFTHDLFARRLHGRFETVPLGEIAEIRSGVTLGRDISGSVVELPYLRVANVQDGFLDLKLVKKVAVREDEAEKWTLQGGDLLLTEGGDWDKLGRGTIWENQIPNCIHQNHIFRVRLKLPEYDPWYLLTLTGSPYGKAYFQGMSKQTTNLASINQAQLKAFPVYSLPIGEQHRIVSQARNIAAKVDGLVRIQRQSDAELNAMMPSILYQAFNGEL